MRVCVIDGRGGGLGRRLVVRFRAELGGEHDIIGLATNDRAAEAMKRAGASRIGVGTTAIAETVPMVDVIVGSLVDVIVGSLNVVLPGALLGEVTPSIVQAILDSRAKKVLLPVNRARVEVVGTTPGRLESLISTLLSTVRLLLIEAKHF